MSDHDRDTPLRLADAVRLGFPHGGMSVAGLRREAQRGNLRMWRIANKDFTTLAAISEMMEKCQVRPLALPAERWRADAISPRSPEQAMKDARTILQGLRKKGHAPTLRKSA